MATRDATPSVKATLGLTGLTINAMALIAPGAFLWLTFAMQSQYGAPSAGAGMWFGIVVALALCFATAIAYAELSKLYPGAGSSYFFAEQAFLSKTSAFKFARLAKFVVGWASHLYYWVYPGVMVGVTALVVGYMVGQIWPTVFSAAVPSPLFMILFCIVFAFGVAWIAFRGVTGTTGVNMAINIIQITALLIFSVMAISYRVNHPEGTPGWTVVDGNVVNTVAATDDAGKPKLDAAGNPVMESFKASYTADGASTKNDDGSVAFNYHTSPGSVVAPHAISFAFIQACVAILILVGFESVTSMGEEARNAKRDIPRAVLLSLGIQGIVCYLIEYFAANYFLHNGYTMVMAAGDSAPIGTMAQMIGAWAFGSPTAGWWFMMVIATTVVLALIGTTLSCMSTGARVTYAMGRDDEVPSHFGLLHGKRLTPHRAIWTLAGISAFIGVVACILTFCGPAAQTDEAIGALPKNLWYSFGLWSHSTAENIPSGMLVVTLVSNFGTFMLYMLTCLVAIVAFRQHHTFSGIKHMVIPVFGLLANLACMLFYIVGPFAVTGMSKKEPFWALGVAGAWGLYGAFYFLKSSKAKGRSVFLASPAPQPGVA